MSESNLSKIKTNSYLDNKLDKIYAHEQTQNKNNIDKKYGADSGSKKNKQSIIPLTKYMSY